MNELSLNANVSVMASDGITALHMAAMKCHYKSCKILVNVGKANCRLVTSKKKQNVLHLVASNAKKYCKKENTSSYEIANNNTNHSDEQDNTGCGDASGTTNDGSVLDLVKFFVKKKVDVFARDKKGNTPKDIASQAGVTEIEEFLKDEMQRQSMMKKSSMKEKDVNNNNNNNNNANTNNKGKRSGVAHDLLHQGSNTNTTNNEENVQKRQKTNTGGVSLSHLLKDNDDEDNEE